MQRRDLTTALLLAACSGAPLFAQNNSKRTLRLCTPDHLGYWTTRGGKVVSAAYLNLEIALDVTYLPAKRAIEESNAGVFDGELGRVAAIEPHYPNLKRVPTSIGTYVLTPVTAKPTGQNLSSIDALRNSGLHIGTMLGMRPVIDQLQGIKVETAVTPQSVLQMLAFNRIDVAVLPQGLLQIWQGALPADAREALKQAVELEPIQSSPLYHYLHKKNSDLIPAVDQELQKLARNGTIKRIWAAPD